MQAEGTETRLKRWWFAGGEPRLGALDLGLIAGFVTLLLAGAWFAEAFFTERNMSNLMRQVVANGLISLGMLLVILTGGIDLSVGSVVALGGVLFAGIADQLGIGAALAIAIAGGAAAGLVNGVIVARFKLQSFIVTLATMGIVRGCVYLYSEVPLSPSHPGFRDIGATLVGSVPLSMIIMLACYALVWCYLNRTPAGRATVAIGGNEEAVRLAGACPLPVSFVDQRGQHRRAAVQAADGVAEGGMAHHRRAVRSRRPRSAGPTLAPASSHRRGNREKRWRAERGHRHHDELRVQLAQHVVAEPEFGRTSTE